MPWPSSRVTIAGARPTASRILLPYTFVCACTHIHIRIYIHWYSQRRVHRVTERERERKREREGGGEIVNEILIRVGRARCCCCCCGSCAPPLLFLSVTPTRARAALSRPWVAGCWWDFVGRAGCCCAGICESCKWFELRCCCCVGGGGSVGAGGFKRGRGGILLSLFFCTLSMGDFRGV